MSLKVRNVSIFSHFLIYPNLICDIQQQHITLFLKHRLPTARTQESKLYGYTTELRDFYCQHSWYPSVSTNVFSRVKGL